MDTMNMSCTGGPLNPEVFRPISPNHYSRFNIEPIDFIEKNNLGFAAGNVVKYVCRHDAKNGIEDLKKAKRYLEFLIAKEEGNDPSSACG